MQRIVLTCTFLVLLGTASYTAGIGPAPEPVDQRSTVIAGSVPCIEWVADVLTFRLLCSFSWLDFFGPADFISLHANEAFDGDGAYTVDLSGITSFQGMFTSAANAVTESVAVSSVHTENGALAAHGGYIMRQNQSYYFLSSCSSTGEIGSLGSGGISGDYNSFASISCCYSSGDISGEGAGGIMGGFAVAVDVGRCDSSGSIGGKGAGGILGQFAGFEGDQDTEVRSASSTGLIHGEGSGGICGAYAGQGTTLKVLICRSSGNITGKGSGGLLGSHAAMEGDWLSISWGYTLGDVSGVDSGGIAGRSFGIETRLTISIEEVYVAGAVSGEGAAGITPSVASPTVVKHSVISSGSFVGDTSNVTDGDTLFTQGNTVGLDSIRGKLYSVDGEVVWETFPSPWIVEPGKLPSFGPFGPHQCLTKGNEATTPTILINNRPSGNASLLPCPNRQILVSILSDDEFDSTKINASSIRMGRQSLVEQEKGCKAQSTMKDRDVDRDGKSDFVFRCVGDTGMSIKNDSDRLVVTGNTDAGQNFETDVKVRIIGSQARREQLYALERK
eukprot:gb/GECG01015940.1/.p1 GENE.gb/GECG01015940.1/~~gb/GECG01015940.1/.p1  ORF type:complete len:559 (+),score=62.93 gb/GECG01015940.1/:1-1677(+)